MSPHRPISIVSHRRTAGRVLAGTAAVLLLAAAGGATAERTAILLEVKGAIGPATADYVVRGIAAAQQRGAAAIVLRMDTPGGLDSSMRDIIKAILAAPVPVATYVTPSGARAASAGTYILYASHIAAMAPGTNLGAATPVQIGGLPSSPPADEKPAPDKATRKTDDKSPADKGDTTTAERTPVPVEDAMSAKAINDAAAYIRGLAELRGRNVEWAERAVREAASLSSGEALAQHVIDIVATDVADLLRQAHGRSVGVAGRATTLDTAGLALEAIDPDWRTRLLAVITDPNVAVILMLIGIYGLIFEFSSPGAVLPGVVGAIALLMGLYALNLLPVNFAGLGLILLGIALMAAEAFVVSHGVLAVGGAIAFLIGATLLFDSEVPGMALSWPVTIALTAMSLALFAVVLSMAVRSRRRQVVSGREDMIGGTGRVVSWGGDGGWVFVRGEQWRATSGQALTAGQTVRVVDIRNLTLTVVPDQ